MMDYKYSMRADNIYAIDTKMFGFDRYSSAFLVEGKELALVDTGLPNQLESVREGIKSHGFSISDISYIFVTHCEHPDHSGNAGALLREAPRARVFINPAGLEFLTNPAIEDSKRRKELPKKMADRFGDMEPVPLSRIELMKDGDIFDLGGGERLKIIFSPGHQPSGLVIIEEKNRGLFINDFVGNYFADADYLTVLNPFRSDIKEAFQLLKKMMEVPIRRLYLGHFGIHDNPEKIMQLALGKMVQLMDIGDECIGRGKPEEIESRVLAIKLKEADKLKSNKRGFSV